uniref:C2H2-type domain-containing protein n=1 Tax=Plectus sambesii TaxID=2011161 RepID=A0A914X631_9BILA
MTETASACCYLCNECDSTFASLEELENHMTGTHADGNHEDTVAAAADKCADDDEDEAGFGSSNHEDMDTTPHGMDQSAIQDHSPSSSDTSNYDHSSDPSMLGADGGFDPSLSNGSHDGKSYPCRFCSKVFEGRSQLNIHYTHTHRDKPQYECEGSPSGTPFSDVKSESSSTAATPQPADDSPAASTPSATAGAQQQFFCFFCMRQFGSQAAYTLHLSYVHFRNGVLNPNPQPPTNGDASDEQKVSPSSIPSSGIFGQPLQSQQIDNSHPETQGNRSSFQEAANHESTANSSSSHKSILSSQTPLSIDSGSNCSSCDMCTLLRKRTAELERALTVRDSEIMRLNESMRRVGGIAGNLLESCTDFDKLWMLHSKKVYTQIQSVLCSIE